MPLLPNKKTRFNLSIALRSLAASAATRRPATDGPTDVLLCLVDHFEPHVGKAPDEVPMPGSSRPQ